MISSDSISGAVYGLALGDALGRPTEFMSLKKIYKRYGRSGYMPLSKDALFTDDTQMTIAVSRALTDARFIAPGELVRTITNRFIEWSIVDEPRAPGVSCLTSITNLKKARKQKRSWTTAPVFSKGCGANMRVLPTALLPNDYVDLSQLQAALTHTHPFALAATELTALAIRWAASGIDINELPHMLLERAQVNSMMPSYRRSWLGNLDKAQWRMDGDRVMGIAWDHMINVITKVIRALERGTVIKDVCRELGASWVADEALATALYHAVAYAADPLDVISMAARTSGDSDSIACIAGAIIGGHYGEKAWPTEWMARIERRDDLEEMIDDCTARLTAWR